MDDSFQFTSCYRLSGSALRDFPVGQHGHPTDRVYTGPILHRMKKSVEWFILERSDASQRICGLSSKFWIRTNRKFLVNLTSKYYSSSIIIEISRNCLVHRSITLLILLNHIIDLSLSRREVKVPRNMVSSAHITGDERIFRARTQVVAAT